MNKKEVELTKYFDNMCIIFNTKKVMFSEWEKYFKKLEILDKKHNQILKQYGQ